MTTNSSPGSSPDLATPRPESISRCSFALGWHVYGAGPCFDTEEQAVAYRDALDARGLTWWPQDKPLPPLQGDKP